eukprot:210304_1
MAFLATKIELAACIVGLLPAVYLFYFYFFVAKSDKERKHKGYHISGEWAMRFLWLSLVIIPISHFTQLSYILPLIYLFGALSECYVMIHVFIYLRFTLIRDGFTASALLNQIQTRDYLIWGLCASCCGIIFVSTYNRFVLFFDTLFASYHIMTRNWDRLRKGKSP